MKSTSASRLVLPLGLLLLVLCSTGLALRCYNCDWSPHECRIPVECDAKAEGCLTVIKQDGLSLHRCRPESKCDTAGISTTLGITTRINVQCCEGDLCNKGFAGLPASGLILCLAAALLVFFS